MWVIGNKQFFKVGLNLQQVQLNFYITANMVLSLIYKMKLGKSPGPSNVITEILKASPDHCSQLIAGLINAIIK